jgi:hypothetical protein
MQAGPQHGWLTSRAHVDAQSTGEHSAAALEYLDVELSVVGGREPEPQCQLDIRILKRRGGMLARTLRIDVRAGR